MAQYLYEKGEQCYCKTLFGYKQVTIIDRKAVIIDFDFGYPSTDYVYLIKFKNGRLKAVNSEKLF